MGSIEGPVGPFNVKKIAIVGAGPTGLAAAKYLIAENAFDTVHIYEQQGEVGGVWNYISNNCESVSVPQTTPHVEAPSATIIKGHFPYFSNPMYERLNTNIPKNLMRFSDQEFPPDSLLFPSRQDIQEYLIKYSQDIRDRILFACQVENISLEVVDGHDVWTIEARSTFSGQELTNVYDAVVIANGHYSLPWIPDVPGIKEFHAAHPSVISHSKIFRSPEAFADKKVIVVGNAASGLDIGNQISTVCQKPLLLSVRELPEMPTAMENKKEFPAIAEYLVEDRAVRFEDGRIEKDIDSIVYCTGYLYWYPFLKSLDPPLVTTGSRAMGLWQQLLHIDHPTLAFTALGMRIIPFPTSEAQGAALAKVWTNNISLPSKEEMQDWEARRVRDLGDGQSFNVYGYPRDADYINYMHDWVASSTNGFSKEPPFWGGEKRWLRSLYADIKAKSAEQGGTAKTLEELGFKYEASPDAKL